MCRIARRRSAQVTDGIFLRARAVIERIVGAERLPSEVTPGTRLVDDYWLDSVEMLEVLLACEVEFGIVFAESGDLDGTRLETVGSLVDLIRGRLASGAEGL
jgi:acyl carrier protein